MGRAWAERYPGLFRVLGWARWALLVVGTIWVLALMVWRPGLREGVQAYAGCLWIALCWFALGVTRTLRLRTFLVLFSVGLTWALVIAGSSVLISDVALESPMERLGHLLGDRTGDSPLDTGGEVGTVAATVGVAGIVEESLKVLPLALIALAAPRRTARFGAVDWGLLGVLFGAAFLAVEEFIRRVAIMGTEMAPLQKLMCALKGTPEDPLSCASVHRFGLWPFGGTPAEEGLSHFAGHHVTTGLIGVSVGLGVALWRSAVPGVAAWRTRQALALLLPIALWIVVVVDHMVRNTTASHPQWLADGGEPGPWWLWWSFVLTGRGEGRELLLLALMAVAVLVDADRYARHDLPLGRALLGWATPQAARGGRDGTGGAVSRVVHRLDAGVRALAADVVLGVLAFSREGVSSRAEAVSSGRAYLVARREGRFAANVADEDRVAGTWVFRRWLTRIVAGAALVGLLVAVWVLTPAVVRALDASDGFDMFWLAGLLASFAEWWDSLGPVGQLAVTIGLTALLAGPFGLGWALFAAGLVDFIGRKGDGLAALLLDPGQTWDDYLASRTPAEVALDLLDLGLTFWPPGRAQKVLPELRKDLEIQAHRERFTREAWEGRVGDERGPQINKLIGDEAADSIASRYTVAAREEYFPVDGLGGRRVDILTKEGVAIESKVGRVGLKTTPKGHSIVDQIAKDKALLDDPTSPVKSVEWHFTKSPITGRGGPTEPLRRALEEAGITIVEY